ncbi:MAG TPA: sulfotransferase [Steroidobacteraceae bacterium]
MTPSASSSRDRLADQATRCIDANDLRGALAACEQLNRAHPGDAYGWYLASFALKRARNLPEAVKAIDRALALDAMDRYVLHKAKCVFEARDRAAAQETLAPLLGRDFDDARLHEEVGSLCNLLGNYPGALRHFSRAVELEPRNAEFLFNRAALQRYMGDAAGAEAGFDAVIALRPDEYEAYNARAQVRTQTEARNHVAQLRARLERTIAPAGVVQLSFALAKELEDLGEDAASFAALRRGADTKRAHMRYDVATDEAIMARIREVFGPDRFSRRPAGCDGNDPIFIVGLPRTGTTLVERIVGSHSAVCPAGELNEFSLALIDLTRRLPGPPPASRLDFVDATARIDFRALGEAYLASTRPLRDARPRFIDKLPFNFLYAGLIHLALPRARIISLRRHPLDTCYAVYKQLFRDAYPYSYDLDDLGRYYVAYDALMRHWDAVLPGVIHTVCYEDVVADVERETRRLLEYCGLPWEDACLEFHASTQASTTASALQVRQPIYDTSVGKWRRFAGQLEPLRARMLSAGIEVGGA